MDGSHYHAGLIGCNATVAVGQAHTSDGHPLRRVPEPLPAADDIPGLAAYWKEYYDTPRERGTAGEFVDKFETYAIGTGRAPHA